MFFCFFFFQAEDGIRDVAVTGVQTCALPISSAWAMVSLMVFMRLPQESCETLGAQVTPAIREEAQPIRHIPHGSLISDAAREPGMGGIREDAAPDRESAHELEARSKLQGAAQLLDRCIEAQHEDTAAMRIMRLYRLGARRPPLLTRLRLQLPPVRLDAKLIQPSEHVRNRVVAHAAVFAGNDFEQQFPAE